jgi:hypothetical protein
VSDAEKIRQEVLSIEGGQRQKEGQED